ncbi:hypothetical protein T439DRAFT_322610 [Meredithblackwellia eburnea MCA 4105]
MEEHEQSTLVAPPQSHLFPPASSHNQQPTQHIEPINDNLARDFPDVANLSREDMTALLEDEAYFDAFFNCLPQSLAQHQSLEQRIKSNLAIAQKNEGLRPQLEALRTATGNLYNEVTELKARWAHLEAAQAEVHRKFNPQTQMNRLRSATTAQEHLSESLANSFQNGDIDDETFARQYKDIRKVYHRRAVNLEKWEAGSVVWRN